MDIEETEREETEAEREDEEGAVNVNCSYLTYRVGVPYIDGIPAGKEDIFRSLEVREGGS